MVLIIECCKVNKKSDKMKYFLSKINDWEEFIHMATMHGVLPLIYKKLKEYQNKVPKDVFSKIKMINMDIVKTNMLMTAELLKVMKLFKENNIEVIAFKGPTLSLIAYGDITLRQFSDLDLLIKYTDFSLAKEILNDNNYKNKLTYNIAGKKVQDLLSDHAFIDEKSNIYLELHNKLFSIDFPIKLDNNEFMRTITSVRINNNSLNTFSKEYLLVYLCLHGSKHMYSRVSWILDIDKLISRHDLDWNIIEKLVIKFNAKTFFYTSLFLSMELFETKFPKHIQNKYNLKYKILIKKILKNEKKIEIGFSFSFLHLYMFDGFKYKLDYILYIFKPTYLDYQSLNKEYNSKLLYYFLRPFNILKRYFRF